MSRETRIRRQAAASLNALIDRALAHPDRERAQAVLAAASFSGALLERVRRRAATLARHQGARRLAARDRLGRMLCAAGLSPGWHAGWADASVLPDRAAGIGGVLADREGRVLARVRQGTGPLAPFEAEIAAAAAVVAAAVRHGVVRLRLHTDCRALPDMWHCRRNDPRLAPLRAAARRLDRFEFRLVPRLQNQPANRLARAAALRAGAIRGRSPRRRTSEQGSA